MPLIVNFKKVGSILKQPPKNVGGRICFVFDLQMYEGSLCFMNNSIKFTKQYTY